MTKKEFWKIVKEIDWKYRESYKGIVVENAKEAFDITREYEQRLSDAIKGYCTTNNIKLHQLLGRSIGDDSYWHLRAHIVGLGESVYFKVLKHPETIKEYANSFRENFEYCFHESMQLEEEKAKCIEQKNAESMTKEEALTILKKAIDYAPDGSNREGTWCLSIEGVKAIKVAIEYMTNK